jgi:hypothetical protein
MKRTSGLAEKVSGKAAAKAVRRDTRRRFSAQEIRFVLEGLRGEDGIGSPCRRVDLSR